MENSSKRSSGTLRGLRDPLPWPEGKPFRILSIDGGGIRGILPAAILSQLEEQFLGGRPVGSYFDLIAGTSTGGILALGLATGHEASELYRLYIEHGAEVFPRPKWDLFKVRAGVRWIRSLRHYAYDPEPLRSRLVGVFGEHILGEATCRVCVPSFDDFTEVNVFKTPHHPDYKKDWRERLLTIAMATAAAPTFFPMYRDGLRVFGDGGVWANDPVMIGLVDALVCNQIERRQVHILSIGTGDTDMYVKADQVLRGGLWHWREILSSAMHLQSQNALGQAGLLIGRDQLVRLNAPSMPDNPINLDDYERARNDLPPIAHRLLREHANVIRERFLFEPAIPYHAYYGPRSTQETTMVRN